MAIILQKKLKTRRESSQFSYNPMELTSVNTDKMYNAQQNTMICSSLTSAKSQHLIFGTKSKI